MEDILVTEETFPAVFQAFREIDLDNGAINRLEPALDEYPVPGRYEADLVITELFLSRLTAEELEEFCCGEQTNKTHLSSSSQSIADRFLNAYFEDWMES